MSLSLPVAAAIVVLILVVVSSYAQTIRAYPSGGGAYVVAKDNIGRAAGLVAGASLLIGYVLTVAVSLSAGVAAITSAFPSLRPHTVLIAMVALGLITVANLRGVREMGRIFALPTYVFIASLVALIVTGIWRAWYGTLPEPQAYALDAAAPITAFLLLRAFAAGCTALTGVEVISNGVQSFKKPEVRNARLTLYAMGGVLAFLFLGITFLARTLGIVPDHAETAVSQVAASVFGRGFMYYVIQAGTAVVLLLAANSSYAGFPSLASILAKDRYLPVQLVNQGDRLVYSNGIIALSFCSALLIVAFGGDTHRLIPLYAMSIFLGFTISQFGMTKKWLTERPPRWPLRTSLNLVGALATGTVLVTVTVSRFHGGAWTILVVLPLLVAMMVGTNRHYRHLKTKLTLTEEQQIPIPDQHVVILFVSDIHKGTVAAMRYAKALKPTFIKALHIAFDERGAHDIREKWNKWGMDIPLIIVPSPYRQLTEILLHYIREIDRQHPHAAITVVLPEFVCPHWWQLLLHNQTAARIKQELLHEHVSVVSVPIQLK